ncbi:TonB-dependent receptor [Puteibacter caeruleilacunae]|nr:TonB-dependent receptor [Puteibacter caeruleilacunae]
MKIKYISWCIVVLLGLVYQKSIAQNKITGRIVDKVSHEALPSANVYIPEQHKGTLTDENGMYSLMNLPSGKVKVQFSFVGYKTIIKTIFVNGHDTELNVEMEPSILQAEEVVVSGGTYSSQHENSIKIELMSAKKVESYGSPSFIESLTALPGVDMISKGAGVAKPVIRGLSMTNILLVNNGVKMENFQFSENHPYIVDEFGSDGVEVIKGPASLLYGSDAVGGVINVIKEKPAPTGKVRGDYNMQYHSNTRGVVGNVGVKGSSESVFWGVRGGLKSHADFKDGNGDYVPNTRFNENSFKANFGIKKENGVFRFYYDYNRPKLGMCVGPAISLVTDHGRDNDVWYQDLTNHIVATRNTLFLNKYKVDVNASYQMNNRRLQTDDSKPAKEMVDMDMNTFSYEVKTYFPSGLGSEYILGIQGANKTNRNNEAPEHVLPDADVNDFSAFGLIQHTFFEDLKTQVGVRYDFRNISTEGDEHMAAVDSDYDNLSASLGATYHVGLHVLLRTNVATAYRTPNIAELTQDGMHGERFERGNSDLKSQRSYEGDLSAHYHSKHVMVDVSGFYNRINDYIYMAPTDETSEHGDRIYEYQQTNSKLYGGELVVDVLPVSWLNLNASYAYLIGKRTDGSYLPFIPQNKLRFEMKIQGSDLNFLKNPYFKLGGLNAAKQDNPSAFETETDSYVVINAGIGGEIKLKNEVITLSVQANNLFNETYTDHLSTLKEVGYHNMGRNISVNLKIPFGLK